MNIDDIPLGTVYRYVFDDTIMCVKIVLCIKSDAVGMMGDKNISFCLSSGPMVQQYA